MAVRGLATFRARRQPRGRRGVHTRYGEDLQLASVARAVGGMRALYDAGSARVKERGLQHLCPDEPRLAELLAEDPLLLRTPIVRDGTRAAVGAAEAVWKTFADAAKGKA